MRKSKIYELSICLRTPTMTSNSWWRGTCRPCSRQSYLLSSLEQRRTDDEQYSEKKQDNTGRRTHKRDSECFPIYGAKCLWDENICGCWATSEDDGKSLRSLHKFTPKSRMQGITEAPEDTRCGKHWARVRRTVLKQAWANYSPGDICGPLGLLIRSAQLEEIIIIVNNS